MATYPTDQVRRISKKLTLIIISALIILIIASPVTASALPRKDSTIQLANAQPSPLDEFGYSVAVNGGLVLVGSPYFANAGSASLFNARTGALLLTLASQNFVDLGNTFGWSVSIGNGLLVVGAPRETSIGHVDAFGNPIEGGNAYVFNASTGGPIFTLTSPNPQGRGFFGESVSVGDGLIVIGAPYENLGNAYVFSAHSGGLLDTLSNPEPQRGRFFGFSTSVGGGVIGIGAPLETSTGQNFAAGKVYVFDAQKDSLLFALDNPNPNPPGIYGGGEFGQSVSVSDGLIVAGAPNNGAAGIQPGPGNAYVFNAHTGELVSTLTSPTQWLGGRFGGSVAVASGTVVVGAPNEGVAGHPEAGTAYLFSSRTGNLLSTLTEPNPQTKALFGYSVGVNAELAVVGAPFPEGNCFNIPCVPGAAYIF